MFYWWSWDPAVIIVVRHWRLLTCHHRPQFSLSPDPSSWGADISPNHAEPDDYLHNPDPRRDRKNDKGGNVFTYRGLTNLGCLLLLVAGIVTLLYELLSSS
jgi:beta-glucan synthesis-associated protein KRE6